MQVGGVFSAIAAALEGAPFNVSEWELYSFPQTWGDTSLGRGGAAAQAICSAQTTVLYHTLNDEVWVFIGPTRRYKLSSPSQSFWEDLARHNVAGHLTPRYLTERSKRQEAGRD